MIYISYWFDVSNYLKSEADDCYNTSFSFTAYNIFTVVSKVEFHE